MWLSDEEYVYRKDIAEKKRIGYGAAHKVNGSKSKKCNFPSDYLTRKEKMKMNSECVSWNMNEFYTYNDFKKMPRDIQIEYLQTIANKYKVGPGAISKTLFGQSESTLREHLKNHHILDKIKFCSFTGAKARAYNAEFERVVDKYRLAIVDILPETVEETPAPDPVPVVTDSRTESKTIGVLRTFSSEDFKSTPRNCSMECSGFDLDLFHYLAERYRGMNVNVEIRVTVKE